MSAAIEKRDDMIDSLRSRLSNLRRAADAESRELMGLGASVGTAYAYGAMERRAESTGRPMSSPIDGVSPRLAYGGMLYVAGRFVGGDAGLALQSGGKALLMVHAYLQGRDSASGSGAGR